MAKVEIPVPGIEPGAARRNEKQMFLESGLC